MLLKKVEQKRLAHFDEVILGLQLIYARTMKLKRPSVHDAFAAAYKIIYSHTLLPEFHFLLVSVILMIFASGVFIASGADYESMHLVLLAVTSIYAGILPLALAFLTLPFHLLINASLWLMTGIHMVITSLIFCATQPLIGAALLNYSPASFYDLIIPMTVFYGIANFYMLSRVNDIQNYQLYKKRHSQVGLEHIIPPPKMGAIISMSSQDHYVEFTTENGRHLERLTLAKAMDLAPKAAGIQVHRSHWVACRYILKLEKSGGRYAALLRNGSKIPVGKSKVTKVQDCLEQR